MLQKIIVGVLVLTIVGAIAVGAYDAAQQTPSEETTTTALTVENRNGQGGPQGNGQGNTASGTGVLSQQIQQSQDTVGDPWTASGTIADLTDFGLTLQLADGSQVYVELGPPEYWQAQGVTLAAGETVQVDGFFNGEQVHARIITATNAAQLTLRTEAGQPLWAGGSEQSANGTGQAQVAPEDWITINGTVTAVTASGLTMQTETGESLTLQLGQSTFWQNQGVTLAVGDQIAVIGFWQGTQFQAGDITRVATGERIMLRDPNGRPLWAGPGRNGSGGQGNGGQGNGGQGQSGSASGQGNGYHGGRSN